MKSAGWAISFKGYRGLAPGRVSNAEISPGPTCGGAPGSRRRRDLGTGGNREWVWRSRGRVRPRERAARLPRAEATLMRVTWFALALLVAGCADDLALSPSFHECTASDDAVDAYLGRIAGLASNRSRADVLEPHESATVSFVLGHD